MDRRHLEKALSIVDPARAGDYGALVIATITTEGRLAIQTLGPENDVVCLGEMISFQAKAKMMGILPGIPAAEIASEDLSLVEDE